ncbi:uncharacterized protein BKA55DRAFT_276950 [Fusarium redolens]|uniref:Uncharacterized protein n=1 Tax=Fusarium redolens TaxID=48865 RepID=A0A9P9HPN3_FUSRE|nr:uncharacterized protein BKA55DRAFT_276950 [Fusarium redolens]KAH7261181.1 hypothetical protein BKA55DRAFT_276950 [Fusarium redolens]
MNNILIQGCIQGIVTKTNRSISLVKLAYTSRYVQRRLLFPVLLLFLIVTLIFFLVCTCYSCFSALNGLSKLYLEPIKRVHIVFLAVYFLLFRFTCLATVGGSLCTIRVFGER